MTEASPAHTGGVLGGVEGKRVLSDRVSGGSGGPALDRAPSRMGSIPCPHRRRPPTAHGAVAVGLRPSPPGSLW